MKKNLSSYSSEKIPSAKKLRFAIVVSDWNSEITEALYSGAEETILKHGGSRKRITRINVPGSFELISGAKHAIKEYKPDAVICIGCIIQGDTRHFEFIANAVADGIMQLNILHDIPFVFGVLTTDTLQQAKERAGGKSGNKGVEAAVTAIRMAVL